jgi:HEAT repeat protein
MMIACVLVFAGCQAAKETKRMRAQDLIQQLRTSADAHAREDAADSLWRDHLVDVDGALDALVQAARSDDNEIVRSTAVRALGKAGDKRAVEPLIGLWRKSEDGALHNRAVDALSNIGNAAIPALIEALSDPEWRVRYHASRTLGNLADPVAHPRLRELASDPHDMVRNAAKWALEQQTPAIIH